MISMPAPRRRRSTIRKGDFVIVRTGQMEACNSSGEWGGYAGGDAPGLKFESCYWLQEKEVAGVCSDTWGVEVRPNETKDVNQPWHWVVIPAMGLYMGEMFDLKELAEDCAKDKVYEFFFCGAAPDHSGRAPARPSIRRPSSSFEQHWHREPCRHETLYILALTSDLQGAHCPQPQGP